MSIKISITISNTKSISSNINVICKSYSILIKNLNTQNQQRLSGEIINGLTFGQFP